VSLINFRRKTVYLSIVIPLLNEEENIPILYGELKEVLEAQEIDTS
jgi:hypothetical protein